MKLYADYILERQGLKLINKEICFASYRVVGDELFISEFFVQKEYRKSGVGRSLLKEILEVSLNEKCAVVTANIHVKDPNHNETLMAVLACGFKVVAAQNDVILISLSVKED